MKYTFNYQINGCVEMEIPEGVVPDEVTRWFIAHLSRGESISQVQLRERELAEEGKAATLIALHPVLASVNFRGSDDKNVV